MTGETFPVPIRNRILWFGGRSGRDGDDEFKNRDLILDCRHLSPLTDQDLIGVRGIVYCLDGVERTAVRKHLLANLARIENHGVATYLLAPQDSDITHLQDQVEAAGLSRLSDVGTGPPGHPPDHAIAQAFLRHNPRLPWSDGVTIDKPKWVKLSAADELLLKRAFSDTKTIRLEPLSGGKTADAFQVHARFEKGSVLVRPLPYFAKIGPRSKIEIERANYEKLANFYIPFHLRPNIDDNRTVLGSTRGCLVGNFVEFAKPLWTTIEDGNFSAAVNALFDQTLSGWWSQAFNNQGGVTKNQSVAGELGDQIFDHRNVIPEHLDQASSWGLRKSPTEIYEALLDRSGEETFYRVPFHADLHPDNIFVRNGDAILIDLGSARMGPIAGDPACLEVALAMDVRFSDVGIDPNRWNTDVDRLFACEAFDLPLTPVDAQTPWQHRINAVRKVRTLAQAAQTCPTGYQSAIAMYLLRRAMYAAHDFREQPRRFRQELQAIDAHRRAYALILAERLVFGVSESKNDNQRRPQNPPPRNGRKPSRSQRSSRGGRR